MAFGDRVRDLRIGKGITQDELAKMVGYSSRSTINKIEKNERNVGQSMIVKFAKALDTTPTFLTGWGEDNEIEPNADILPTEKIRMIPVFESVSAGFGAYACSDVSDYIPLYIQSDYEAEETICIKVKGDSMYPKIEDGDLVVVRKQSSVDSGQIAVVLVDGDNGYVKKIVYDKVHIELISINPEYQPKIFRGCEAERVAIVGLVKQNVRDVGVACSNHVTSTIKNPHKWLQ